MWKTVMLLRKKRTETNEFLLRLVIGLKNFSVHTIASYTLPITGVWVNATALHVNKSAYCTRAGEAELFAFRFACACTAHAFTLCALVSKMGLLTYWIASSPHVHMTVPIPALLDDEGPAFLPLEVK